MKRLDGKSADLIVDNKDGGNLRFVLAQIPEPLPKPETHLQTLADITKEHPDWNSDAVFHDNAFENDVAKAGIANVRSL